MSIDDENIRIYKQPVVNCSSVLTQHSAETEKENLRIIG
jgi:hypothetical protein